MDKSQPERKLYQAIDEGSNSIKIKEKVRKQICITRVVMYLYANFILHEMDVKPVLGVLDRLY